MRVVMDGVDIPRCGAGGVTSFSAVLEGFPDSKPLPSGAFHWLITKSDKVNIPRFGSGWVARISEVLVTSPYSSFRSDSDSLTSRARGCSGLNPKPACSRMVTLVVSSRGDLLDGVRKILVRVISLIFSNLARQRFTEVTYASAPH